MAELEALTGLTDLTERTATADSDLIHVNSGGTDYKETKDNFTADIPKFIDFNTSSTLFSQVDALGTNRGRYCGRINANSSSAASTANIPQGAYYVDVYIFNSSYKEIHLTGIDPYTLRTAVKAGGSWGSWVLQMSSGDISALNSSLTNKSDDGTILKPLSTSSESSSGMYCFAKSTLGTAQTITFSMASGALNRYVALLFIVGNDGSVSLYCICYKYGATNSVTKLAGATYSNLTCSTDGTISVPVTTWTTVECICTEKMT